MWKLLLMLCIVSGIVRGAGDVDLGVEAPFRFQKLNLVWNKALKRLSENKQKIIFSDLKLHEKEEITLKRLTADGLDKDGLKEAETRRHLKVILTRFGLADHFYDDIEAPTKDSALNGASEDNLNKALFKDKKLNKLWMKAEKSGFTDAELKTLKEEFVHHQETVNEYYSLLDRNIADSNPEHNLLSNDVARQYEKPEDLIRKKHRDVKDGYDRLHKMSLSGPDSKEFSEPRVHELWIMAQKANFSQQELDSLFTELRHYENRIVKLQYLHGQSNALKKKKKEGDIYGEKDLYEKIKQSERRVSKMETDLQERILQKRFEL